MNGERFRLAAGIKVKHVGFKGASDAQLEVMAGRVHFAIVGLASTLPFIKDGRLIALAVGTPQRSPLLPDVPTIAETLPGYARDGSHSMLAPAGTPRPVLHEDQQGGRTHPRAARRQGAAGELRLRCGADDAGRARRIMRADIATFSGVVRLAGLRPGEVTNGAVEGGKEAAAHEIPGDRARNKKRATIEGGAHETRHVMLVSAVRCASAAHAQGWSPQRNVEIVVGFVPGGGMDRTARTLDRILVTNKLVTSGVSVVNKPGGSSNIAYTYTSQRPADGHTLMIGGGTLLTNHITGASPLHYNDFTVIALLFNDYPVFSVNAASQIRNGKDLIERLKADPKSVTTGYAAVGGGNHISAVLLHKAIGGKTTDLKGVSYKGAAEAITNLLGGHIDLTATQPAA